MSKTIVQFNSSLNQYQTSGKKDEFMDKYIEKYIDKNIIAEYATSYRHDMNLDVSQISPHDQQSLADILFRFDSATHEFVKDRIQELIDDRLPWVNASRNYDAGLRPLHDSQTGEVSWVRR